MTDTVPWNGGRPLNASSAEAVTVVVNDETSTNAATHRRVTGGQVPQFVLNQSFRRWDAALKSVSCKACAACDIAAICWAVGG